MANEWGQKKSYAAMKDLEAHQGELHPLPRAAIALLPQALLQALPAAHLQYLQTQIQQEQSRSE